ARVGLELGPGVVEDADAGAAAVDVVGQAVAVDVLERRLHLQLPAGRDQAALLGVVAGAHDRAVLEALLGPIARVVHDRRRRDLSQGIARRAPQERQAPRPRLELEAAAREPAPDRVLLAVRVDRVAV